MSSPETATRSAEGDAAHTRAARGQQQRRRHAPRGGGGGASSSSAPLRDGQEAAAGTAAAAGGGGGRGRGSERHAQRRPRQRHTDPSAAPRGGRGGGRGGRGGRGARPPSPRVTEIPELPEAPAEEEAAAAAVQSAVTAHSLGALSERAAEMAERLLALTYECLACMEAVGPRQPVWSCGCCYRVFHLRCIQQWAGKQAGDGAAAPATLQCPQCRTPQPLQGYRCFCGKRRDPPFSPLVFPHSCDQACGRARPYCAHPCPGLCHPGPCPPCGVVLGPVRCPCGATTYTYRCGQPPPARTCGGVCGKPLGCGKHACAAPCHTGPCAPCAARERVRCRCGREEREVACGESFECGRPCGRTQRCGRHQCPVVCHAGACPPCDTDPSVVTHCPCGAVELTQPRRSCADPIPTCGAVCGRVLACGAHTCAAACHPGPCAPCAASVVAHCRCRLTTKTVTCGAEAAVRCGRACGTALSCGVHYCRVECCPERGARGSEAHVCLRVCGRPLPCGHACGELCHRGPCPPCLHVTTEPLYCACGTAFLMPPQPCGTAPPSCGAPCARPRPCGHPAAHACHYGECPPCAEPVERECVGGHTTVRAPCSEAAPTCDGLCLRALDCGHHCTRGCHAGPCVSDEHPCRQPCGRPHAGCGHLCARACHPSEPECPPCSAKVEARCPCGRLTRQLKCARAAALAGGDGGGGGGPVLPCDDDCAYHARMAALRDNVQRPPTPPPSRYLYSVFLWRAATGADTRAAAQAEAALGRFARGTEAVVSLPPAPAARRAVVHALAPHYRVLTESVDGGERRSVLLRRTPHTAAPPVLLSAAAALPALRPHRVLTQPPSAHRFVFISPLADDAGAARGGVPESAVMRVLAPLAGSFVPWRDRIAFPDAAALAEAVGVLRRARAVPFRFALSPPEGCATLTEEEIEEGEE